MTLADKLSVRAQKFRVITLVHDLLRRRTRNLEESRGTSY